MKKMMFIAAVALCAMSCGNKTAENTECCAGEEVVVEEVVAEEAVEEVVAEEATIEEVAEEAAIEVVEAAADAAVEAIAK